MTNITFTAFGAAEEVTGTKHLFEYQNTKILFDCGMFQGKRAEAREKNEQFHFQPASVDAVFLSHAHIDHCGLLPRFCKQGFTGKIFCSDATAALLGIMLRDSAHIQESDELFYANHPELYTPFKTEALYTQEDVELCLQQVEVLPIHTPFVFQDVTITLFPAGHVIGSVITQVQAGEKTFIFSGDLGRTNMPILEDREMGLKADVVAVESTYGGRVHEPITLSQQSLQDVIKQTFARGGRVIIPSFALERTQEILYFLEQAFNEGNIPNVPIFVDSPMAIDITKVFQNFNRWYDEDMRDIYKKETPFQRENIVYTHSIEESKKINELHGPAIIIAASGMCESGRIRHHIKHNVGDYRNTILIVGYMAQETLGRKLIEGAKMVALFGENYSVQAQITKLNSFSGHADEPDILSWLESIRGLKKIVLVHGEPNSQALLQEKLVGKFEVEIAKFGESIQL